MRNIIIVLGTKPPILRKLIQIRKENKTGLYKK